MSIEQPSNEGKREKHVVADEAKLNEEKREFLEKKMAQYEVRVKKFEKDMDFIAPEILSEFGAYYGNLAKMVSAKLLLEHGSATKEEVEAFVRNTAREHWEDSYSNNPESVKSVLKDHEPVIQNEVKNGWSVVSAYNEGRMDVVSGSQPV